MEIVGVKATTLEIPYPEEFRAAWHPHIVETLRPATIVQITTDDGIGGIGLAAHLHLCATLRNSPWIEFIIDPPCRTLQSCQKLGGVLAEPLNIDKEGYLNVPSGSGLGVVIDEIALQRFTSDG